MTNKTSTGNYSTGNCSTGNYSTGYCSTGYCSTGNYSTGNYSTGHRSTGHRSTGDYSTGNYSTGDCSTGNCSTGNYSVGHFCTEDYAPHGWFNVPDKRKWSDVNLPSLSLFELTKWIDTNEMSDKEKQDNPSYVTTSGYLRKYEYKEAWANFWAVTSEENKKLFYQLPHFNAEIFKQITGIDINVKPNCEGKEVEIDGVKYILKMKDAR